MSIPIKPLTHFGVEVEADLRESECHAEVKRLFEEYGFLVFRNQQLTHEQQQTLMNQLGPVLDDWTTVGFVSNTREDGILGDSDVSFHSDFIYTPKPLLGVSLHAIDVEDGKTWTRFSSCTNALKKLPAELRERITGLEGLNLFSSTPEALKGHQSLEGYPEDAPRALHPLIHVDPITKKPGLYVTQQNTALIDGVDEAESEALLAQLLEYLLAEENIQEHHWRNGDFLVWSNQAMSHARGGLTPGVPRTLQRVCITEAPASMYRPPVPKERLPSGNQY